MGKDRIKKFAGSILFGKADKAYEKKKGEIVSYIEKEKKDSDKTTMEIIETFAEESQEEAYWIWLMYVLDMGLKLDEENYESAYFTGKCIGCENVFSFTEGDKEKGDVKCDACGKTYTQEDMLAYDG